MPRHSNPLRHELQAAIHNMDRMLKNGWSQRKDAQAVRNAMGSAQAWLDRNPAAKDERVVEWCNAHSRELGMFIPQAHYRRLQRLITEGLKDREKAA